MNPLIIVCFNNLEMTKKAVASAAAQDIPDLRLHVVDNGSTDKTFEWLSEFVGQHDNARGTSHGENLSPTRVANDVLFQHFIVKGAEWVLVMPNDVVLPPNFYREMLRSPRGIVTASECKDESIGTLVIENAVAVSENTPMAVMLIRKWVYEAVMAKDGYFLDENFFHYASDCDLALRVASLGIRGVQLNLPYYHYGSASWRTLDPAGQREAQLQADRDREYFTKKWGFAVDALEYGARAVDLNFKG